MDHWAKTDEDRKAVLLTTYQVAGAYAAHYSVVRTALSIASFAFAYAVVLPGILQPLLSGRVTAHVIVQSGVASFVMLIGFFLSTRLLARTNRARAAALSAQNRRDDDLLFHESSEDPGPPPHLDPDVRASWLIEPFPIFYEDLFRRLAGVRSGWGRGAGNLAYLALTAVSLVLFMLALAKRFYAST